MRKLYGVEPDTPRVARGSNADMEWLVDDALMPGAGLSVARMTLKPGKASEGHRHPNCCEVIHLIAGSVEQTVDDARYVIGPGDTVFVPKGSFHRSRNLGACEAVMIVSYSAGARVYEPTAGNRSSS